MEKIETVVVTGLSGAGKTNAIEWFEDNGYYCVDNMPPALLGDFISLIVNSKKKISKVAICADVRGGVFFAELAEGIKSLKNDERLNCKVLFVEASDKTLIKRFNESRRLHPSVHSTVTGEVIEREREQLRPIRRVSDFVLDTTKMKVSDMKLEVNRLFCLGGSSKFVINIKSFGFKNGAPDESDMIFDMRFIPNPYYVKSLKKLTGRNAKVAAFVLRHEIAQKFLDEIKDLLRTTIPGYMNEGKYHLNIAFGCTGGQHRSVAMAIELAKIMEDAGYLVTLEHRELS